MTTLLPFPEDTRRPASLCTRVLRRKNDNICCSLFVVQKYIDDLLLRIRERGERKNPGRSRLVGLGPANAWGSKGKKCT